MPVAGHHLRSADADLARLTLRHDLAVVIAQDELGRRKRQADRAVVRRQIERIDRRPGRSLGEPVGFDQRTTGDLFPFDRDRFLYRHPAAQRHSQRRKIELGEIRIVDERIE